MHIFLYTVPLSSTIVLLLQLYAYLLVADTLTLYALEPDNSRRSVDDELVDSTSSFECLLYINPTRTDLETIPGTLLWRLNLESKEEIEFNSDVSNDDFIVTTLGNSITLNILGGFLGSVSCIYGDETIKINVVTQGICVDTSLSSVYYASVRMR